jgi:hypothetical protein
MVGKPYTPMMVVLVDLVCFVCLDETNQMNQINHTNQINQSATADRERVVWRGDGPAGPCRLSDRLD